MTPEDDTTTIDDALETAEFDAGFEGKTPPAPAKTEKPQPAATPRTEDDSKSEHVQISRKEWDEVRAAAARTASYDSQFSKAFGTIGNIQKLLNEQKARPAETTAPAPTKTRAEILKEAFAEMERDFPELAQQNKTALERVLAGIPEKANGEFDAEKLQSMLAAHTSKREIEALEDAYPAWREIVGAVDVTKEQPDPNNTFRKWLATKDDAYQKRINGTESAQVIGRAIRTFQNETKAAPKPVTTPRDTARAERIKAAVQPRGDNAGGGAGKTEQDDFEAGYHSR